MRASPVALHSGAVCAADAVEAAVESALRRGERLEQAVLARAFPGGGDDTEGIAAHSCCPGVKQGSLVAWAKLVIAWSMEVGDADGSRRNHIRTVQGA